jgi:heavy metal sensor kinase
MSRLTIRTRVAIWYGAVIVAVLLVVALAMSIVYERIGLERIDGEIDDAARTLDGVIINEIREQATLPQAAEGALSELELPGIGMAIIATDGTVLARRVSGVPDSPVAAINREQPGAPARTLSTARIRIAATAWQHADAAYTIVTWTSLTPLDRERATVQKTMWFAIPIAALVAMLGGWLIARWALKPLTAMAGDAASIDHRRLDRRLTIVNETDELGRLGAAFNAVLDRLSTVVQAQRQFMADASHELRTPVSIAQTATQVTLSAADRSESEYRESLSIIETQMRRLTRVVGDMFMLALADLDARPLEPADLYLNEIVSDCARAARVLGTGRRISIEVSGEAIDVPMCGDEGLLRQLVMNLLDNALRHAPSGGLIHVALERAAGSVELSVEDSGPGVPAGDHTRIFERFVRIGPPGSGGGAGLGLAIAQWIAEQHGGTLRVGGDGHASSRFVLTLPLEPATASVSAS